MEPLSDIDPTVFNNFTITGLIAFICFTTLAIIFRTLIFAVVSKVFGIDRRKKDNGNGNGKHEPSYYKRANGNNPS